MKNCRFVLYAASLLVLIVSASGCVNLMANLLALGGNMNPAEYEGLQKQRVAVIVTSDGGLASDLVCSTLSGALNANLSTRVDDIKLVRNSEIERWLGDNDPSEEAYIEIGNGVKADKVVAIEVLNVSLKNGATLFKGKADVTITVYDTSDDGAVVYRRHLPEFTYPKMDGPSIIDTSENKFRRKFLAILADEIGGRFYEVDVAESFARDASSNSF